MGVGAGLLIAGIGAAASVGGAAIAADGTRDAQNSANKASALAAAQQSTQSFYNYLQSRGVNIQQLIGKYPDIQQEYQKAQAAGDKRDFNTWFVAAIQAAPTHPIWNDIAAPTVGNGAANTTLPAWALDANGQPLQPSLLQQLVAIQSGTNTPQTAPIGQIATLANAHALLQARPDLAQQLADAGVGNDGRTPEQWLVDHITQTESQSGGGTFTDALRSYLSNPSGTAANNGGTAPPAATPPPGSVGAPAGPAGTGDPTKIDPAITAIIPGATNTAAGIFNGDLLKEIQGSLAPVADARLATAGLEAKKIAEQRSLSENVKLAELGNLGNVLAARTGGAQNIYDATVQGASGVWGAEQQAANAEHQANIDKLAQLLNVRREAAAQIYDASMRSAGGTRDARTAGAKGIYDAELLSADAYAQSNEQALARVLAQQQAQRAKQGFGGGSSGSDLTRARATADYLQKGAAARTQAGVNLANRNSETGIDYAKSTGLADVTKQTTLGQSNEADAQAKLAAAVKLAQQLGLSNVNFASNTGKAGVTRASTVASANEADAIGRLTAIVDDARRQMSYLTTDGEIAVAKATEQNALDQLNAIISDQNRRTGSIGVPYQLAGQDLNLKGNLTDQQYSSLDALLKRLGQFSVSQASGPTLTTATPQPVINNGQIIGGALSGLGSAIGTYSTNQQLMDALKKYGSGSTTPDGYNIPSTALKVPANNSVPLVGSGNYLSGATVFGGPG